MPTNRLTPSSVASFRFNSGGPARQIRFDGQLGGFGVRAYRSGRKAYVLQYGPPKKRRLMVIGPCTDGRDVKQARARAHALLREYAAAGADPLGEKRKAEAGTVVAVVEGYIVARQPKWASGEAKAARGRLRLHIGPAIGDVRLENLTRREVREMHARATQTVPTEANRSLQLLRAAINWALSEGGWRAADLHEGENPATRVQLNHEKHRREWIRRDEMPALLAAIDAEDNPWVRAFFRMLLYTGARKSELLNLHWADVDLKRGSLTFRNTKNREDHEVPLHDAAVELLKSVPRMVGNRYVFCGNLRHRPLINVDKPWHRITERAGIERRVTMHDLRRTVGSWLASEGYSTQQIGKLLNHKSAITAKVYAEIADQTKRSMTDAMAELLR